MSAISGLSGYDYGSIYGTDSSQISGSTSANALKSTLTDSDLKNATDEELMDVCKSFESYFIEQIMKEAKKTVKSDEDEENSYIQYFGDTLIQEYAEIVSDQSNLGIAQSLYDSMKRNGI